MTKRKTADPEYDADEEEREVLGQRITDAASPLLVVCNELIGYPLARKKVQRARESVEKAMTLLAEAVKESQS